MQNHPLISVIIPSYNAARYLPQAIESVLAQSYRPFEILVIDDGSTDDTVSVLEKYRSSIRYFRQPNGGPARARNRGIAEARGRYIAFLDADDIWLPNKLSQQVQCLERNAEAALVHSDIYYLDDETQLQSLREVGRASYVGNCYRLLLEHNRIIFSTVLVRRESLAQVGGFDEQIRHASTEDYDLVLRLGRRFPFAYIPEPLTVYRIHNANATKHFQRMLAGHLTVLEKTLRDDPSVLQMLGSRQIRQRLYDLRFSLGYDAFEREDLSAARRYFLRAVLTRQRMPRAGLFFLASCVPAPLLRRLRSRRRKIFHTTLPSESGHSSNQRGSCPSPPASTMCSIAAPSQ
jgi:glycosyltransferase involved in cell wall biosynthesis